MGDLLQSPGSLFTCIRSQSECMFAVTDACSDCMSALEAGAQIIFSQLLNCLPCSGRKAMSAAHTEHAPQTQVALSCAPDLHLIPSSKKQLTEFTSVVRHLHLTNYYHNRLYYIKTRQLRWVSCYTILLANI